MQDLATKMAELTFVAPLAQFEETDEWQIDFPNGNLKAAITDTLNHNIKETDNNLLILDEMVKDISVEDVNKKDSPNCNTNPITVGKDSQNMDNFTETFSSSLEDLVNTFDEKITKCFGNYEQSVEELAPVQVRSQDDIMSECQ